ncbi:hypothetical protein OSTOST_02661 [Ostertagia ostertagi]
MVDAPATDTSAPQKKTLPVESLRRLQKFDEALTALEVAIAPILQVGFDDHMKRRTKQYVERLKSIETRKSAPGLNKRVAKVGIRQKCVVEVPSKRPREDLPEGNNSADQADSDISDNEEIEHNSVSENEDIEHDDEVESVMPAAVEQPSYAVTNIKFEDIEPPQRPARVKTGRRK